jgi:hypothetical protein
MNIGIRTNTIVGKLIITITFMELAGVTLMFWAYTHEMLSFNLNWGTNYSKRSVGAFIQSLEATARVGPQVSNFPKSFCVLQ